MTDIRERLLRVEDDLLSAIVEGTSAIETFDKSWSNLRRDIDIAIQDSSLDDETVSMAYFVSSRIAIYASTFYDLYVDYEDLTSNMVGEVETIMSRLTLGDTSSSAPPLPLRPSSVDEDLLCSVGPLKTDTMRSSVDHGHISPSRSPHGHIPREPSLFSCSSSDENEDEDLPPEPMVGNKRRFSSMHTPESASSIYQAPASKRSRIEIMSYGEAGGSHDLFPQTSLSFENAFSGVDDTDLSELSAFLPSSISLPHTDRRNPSTTLAYRTFEPLIETHEPAPVCRKRRLSDMNSHPAPKRPRGTHCGPRPQAVSDPLPLASGTDARSTSPFDSWFETNFDITQGVSTAAIDPDIPLDIEVSTDWASWCVGCTDEVSAAEKATGPVYGVHQELLSHFNGQSALSNLADISTILYPDGDEVGHLSHIVTDASPEVSSARSGAILECPLDGFLPGDDSPLTWPQLAAQTPFETADIQPPWEVPSTLCDHPVVSPTLGEMDIALLGPTKLPTISSKESPESDIPESCTSPLRSKSPPSQVDKIHALRLEQNGPPIFGSPPPSFLESLSTMPPLRYDRFWDPFDQLPDIDPTSAPPPYHQSPGGRSSTEILLEKVLKFDGQSCNSPCFELHSPLSVL
ncbi:hypothetical protein AcV5_004857 [Taiwanofungus camphoratus]|nr:hypothetical protein AcV5_004857 [Antrodia cinnamomea]